MAEEQGDLGVGGSKPRVRKDFSLTKEAEGIAAARWDATKPADPNKPQIEAPPREYNNPTDK